MKLPEGELAAIHVLITMHKIPLHLEKFRSQFYLHSLTAEHLANMARET